MDYQTRKDRKLLLWWAVKVACGLLLVIGLFIRYLTDWFTPPFAVPEFIPVTLVLIGGFVFLYHYHLIKSQNKILDTADNLVTTGGLFAYIRHPMYLADMFMFTGFTLMAPSPITLSVLAVSIFALVKQALAEDRYLSRLHQTAHDDWTRSTKLLVPAIF